MLFARITVSMVLLTVARSLQAHRPSPPSADNLWHHAHALRLDRCLRKLTGTALLPRPTASPAEASALASNKDLVVVSHGLDADSPEGPLFNYATQAGLDLFEMDWNTFVHTPSRYSAGPVDRAERAELLAIVTRDGVSTNYSGIRVSSSGRKFCIRDAVIWNLFDELGGSDRDSMSIARSAYGTNTYENSLEDRSTFNDVFKHPTGQACIFQLRDVEFLN